MDDDDWDLTVEEMDAIEKEAFQLINQQRNSSSSSSSFLPTPNEVLHFRNSHLWVLT